MEPADRSLARRCEECQAAGRAGLPVAEAVRHLTDAARGIDYLNGIREPGTVAREPVDHRDIKPDNLPLVGGGLKVGDFGLAKLRADTVGSHSGAMSIVYAPPEFFSNQSTATSDQYSLAVTYCVIRGGRPPFVGTTHAVMKGHLEQAPDLSMLPPAEQPAVGRALAKHPAHRWPSCQEFAAAIAAAACHGDTAVPTATVRTAPAVGPGGAPVGANCFDFSDADRPAEAGKSKTKSRTKGRFRLFQRVAGAALILGAVAAYQLRSRLPGGPIGSSIPGLSALANAVRGESGTEVRGFGDTVLRYRDRSYGGSQWRVLENTRNLSAPAGLPAGNAPILKTITGWDRGDFWVGGSTLDIPEVAVLLRYQKGNWRSIGRGAEAQPIYPYALRLTGRESGIMTSMSKTRDRVWAFSPAGVVRVFPDGTDMGSSAIDVAPVGPDEAYLLSWGHGTFRVKAGRQEVVQGADVFLHTGDPSAPNADFLLHSLLYARSPQSGEAFALFFPRFGNDRRIGRYRGGTGAVSGWTPADFTAMEP